MKNKYLVFSLLLIAALIFTAIGYHTRINPNAGKLYYHSSAGDVPASSVQGNPGGPAISGQPFMVQNDNTMLYLGLFITAAVVVAGANEVMKDKQPKPKKRGRRA
jgi:uncharacterized membrane protein YkvI